MKGKQYFYISTTITTDSCDIELAGCGMWTHIHVNTHLATVSECGVDLAGHGRKTIFLYKYNYYNWFVWHWAGWLWHVNTYSCTYTPRNCFTVWCSFCWPWKQNNIFIFKYNFQNLFRVWHWDGWLWHVNTYSCKCTPCNCFRVVQTFGFRLWYRSYYVQ